MIDTDKCEHILYDATYNSIDVYNVAEELLTEVKRLREDLKRTRRWIQKQVQPLKKIASQADLVACTAEKEILDEYIGDD